MKAYQDGRAIAIATAQAEKWAKHRNKPIKKENSTGTTGQAVASDTTSDSEHPIHLLPNPSQDGWVATQNQKRVAQGKEKADVLHKVREQAKTQQNTLYIHARQGQVETQEDYSD